MTYDVMGTSNIDVSLVSPQLEHLVHNWLVLDITDSDHNVLEYTLKLRPGQHHK